MKIKRIGITFVKSEGGDDIEAIRYGNRPSALDKKSFEFLMSNEKRFFEWMSRDKRNPVEFFIDPVAALQKSGIEIERDVLNHLRRIRKRNINSRPSFSKDRVDNLVIKSESVV